MSEDVRYLPHEPLPPYSYVPGQHPHPVSHPGGHSYGTNPPKVALPVTVDGRDCPAYLRGLDLFNHGYYWEAHEIWEALWHKAGRHGVVADFLKSLIKLAAAGVKARQGRVAGVRQHASRAQELLQAIAEELQADQYLGLSLSWLVEQSRSLKENPQAIINTSHADVLRVMPFELKLP